MLVIVPGGPGFASIVPYATLRSKAVAAGFEVVMVEHRGVGLSRRDHEGNDLPADAMRVEYAANDILTVLDELGIQKAWLHGTSYGGYLVQLLGVMAPERVAGMFLDCTWHAAEGERATREYNRDLFLRGTSPDTARVAANVRRILQRGVATDQEAATVVPPIYEFLGPAVLERITRGLPEGRREGWDRFANLVDQELDERSPYLMEFDLAGAIFYRQLYDLAPDGEPFDSALMWAEHGSKYPAFEGEPYDLEAELPGFRWPVVLFSGERDTRTPPFRLEEIASLAPSSLHVRFPNAGHDLFRFRNKEVLAIEAATVRGGLFKAARVAPEVVSESRWHPLTVFGKAFGSYLAVRESLVKESVRRGLIAAAAFAALLMALRAFRGRYQKPRA